MSVESMQFKSLEQVSLEGFEVSLLTCEDQMSKDMYFADSEQDGWALVEGNGTPLTLYYTYRRGFNGNEKGPLIDIKDPLKFDSEVFDSMISEANYNLHSTQDFKERNRIQHFIYKATEYAHQNGYAYQQTVIPATAVEENVPVPDNIHQKVMDFLNQFNNSFEMKDLYLAKEHLLDMVKAQLNPTDLDFLTVDKLEDY